MRYFGTTATNKINLTFTKKIRACRIRRTLAAIEFNIFRLPVFCLNTQVLKCKKWSLHLREENMMVFEKRALRRSEKFASKRRSNRIGS